MGLNIWLKCRLIPWISGCKIKALRAKTNTYIKTPVRGEEPVFVVTGRKEDVGAAKREILSAAEHFSQIRASRRSGGVVGAGAQGLTGATGLVPPPPVPGQVTIQVRCYTFILFSFRTWISLTGGY